MTSSGVAFSSCLVRLFPSMYGGQQEDYIIQSERVIADAIKDVSDGSQFSEIHGLFCAKRAWIAHCHKSEDAHEFGVSRVPSRRQKRIDQSCTPLDGHYEEYQRYSINQISEIVQRMCERDETLFRLEEVFLGKKSVYQVEIVKPDLKDDGVRQLAFEYPKVLKKEIVIGTVFLDGRILTKHYTWLNRDLEPPIVSMRAQSKVILLHHDPRMIRETLDDISKIFAHAIAWDQLRESVDDLKDRVALLRYLYANCMPCLRGDGAIGDWLELLIYRYHGFVNTRFSSERLPNFEPMVHTLLGYRARYDEIIIAAH